MNLHCMNKKDYELIKEDSTENGIFEKTETIGQENY